MNVATHMWWFCVGKNTYYVLSTAGPVAINYGHQAHSSPCELTPLVYLKFPTTLSLLEVPSVRAEWLHGDHLEL